MGRLSRRIPAVVERRRTLVRLTLAVGALLVAGALALDMSGRAPRIAGSDHTGTPVFAAAVPAGGKLCQASPFLPGDAARVQLLIGTYGHPAPELRMRFTGPGGTPAATGNLPSGAREGLLTIPLRRIPGAPPARNFCLQLGRGTNIVLGGEGGPVNASSEFVNGAQQAGRVGLLYLRRGEESWWQLLPALTRRFGLGKASFFGEWTLPAVALLLVVVWVATARLIIRELG
jgi:hypothetical protein